MAARHSLLIICFSVFVTSSSSSPSSFQVPLGARHNQDPLSGIRASQTVQSRSLTGLANLRPNELLAGSGLRGEEAAAQGERLVELQDLRYRRGSTEFGATVGGRDEFGRSRSSSSSGSGSAAVLPEGPQSVVVRESRDHLQC